VSLKTRLACLLSYADGDESARDLSYAVDELAAVLALREETAAGLLAAAEEQQQQSSGYGGQQQQQYTYV